MSRSSRGGFITLGVLALAFYACSGRDTAPVTTESTAAVFSSQPDTEVADAAFDEDAAREKAEEELSSSSYEDSGASYGCTDDCSGHEAGWRWRAENGEQGGNPDSPSFEEGGQAFDDAVEERVEEMRSDHVPGAGE